MNCKLSKFNKLSFLRKIFCHLLAFFGNSTVISHQSHFFDPKCHSIGLLSVTSWTHISKIKQSCDFKQTLDSSFEGIGNLVKSQSIGVESRCCFDALLMVTHFWRWCFVWGPGYSLRPGSVLHFSVQISSDAVPFVFMY